VLLFGLRVSSCVASYSLHSQMVRIIRTTTVLCWKIYDFKCSSGVFWNSYIKGNQTTGYHTCTDKEIRNYDGNTVVKSIHYKNIYIILCTYNSFKLKMMKILKAVIIVNLLLLLAIYSVTSTENITSEKKILNQLEYCVLNDSAIRRRTSDDLLIIVNDTGDWLF